MTVKQALKRKKKLIEEISKAWNRTSEYNSVRAGSYVPYNPIASLAEWESLINELVELKTKIHIANQSVYSKIFELSELKSKAKTLKTLSCTEGLVPGSRWESPNAEPITMTAAISLLDRDQMVEKLELRIEELQDELDAHNSRTEI